MQPGALWLRTILLKNGMAASDEQLRLLEEYVGILLEWNKKVNLVSRKDEDHIWENHILHSLSLLFKIDLAGEPKALDLGSGGGLPGIPLRILLPGIKLVLLDSIQKKVVALRDMIERLGLSGVTAECGRAEELGKRREHHRKYDLVFARGVAALPELIRHAALFLNPGSGTLREAGIVMSPNSGREPIRGPALLAYKGGVLDEELAKAKRSGSVKSITTIDLVFQGSEEVSLTEKKIVVVGF